MSKRKIVNRYTIGQLDRIEVRQIKSKEYITEILENIEKYNNNPKNSYFLGDVQINRHAKIITFKRYKKLSVPCTLAEIDKSTTYFRSEHNLKLLYGLDLKNHHPLLILYRANKKIKTLPIIYDKKYIDREYVSEKIMSYGTDINFLNRILNNELIKSSTIQSIDDFDNLYALRETLKFELSPLVSLHSLKSFYNSFITDGKKDFNYFNFRLLSLILKEYEDEYNKTETEDNTEEQNEEIPGQMMMSDYANLILKSTYEELEIMITDGSLDEAYEKKLIKAYKTTK